MEILKLLRNLNHIKVVDYSQIAITSIDEVDVMVEFLTNNSSLEDIKMPKIQIADENINKQSSLELMKALFS